MKAFYNKILLFSIFSMLIWSCKKEETRVIAASDSASSLTVSATTLVLTRASSANDAITFTFTVPQYGYDAVVTNTLQIGLKGSNFASPKEFSLPANAVSKTFTGVEFNALLLSMNILPEATADLEVRIKSSLSAHAVPQLSNLAAIKATTYALVSYIYVPGDYQGWNPSTADSLRSATSNGIYEGIIKYNAGGSFEFKITPEKKWDVAYGDSGGGQLSTTGGNIKVRGAGSYMLTANLNTKEFTAVPFVWGIIGDAPVGSNWANDIDMTYNNGTQVWSATVVMGTGAFKFRKNHDWGVNFGDKTGDLILDTENNNDIPVTAAGTYKIEMSLVTNTYTITKL